MALTETSERCHLAAPLPEPSIDLWGEFGGGGGGAGAKNCMKPQAVEPESFLPGAPRSPTAGRLFMLTSYLEIKLRFGN